MSTGNRLPVAILAGGRATRLLPLTEQIPKALVEVAGKPFVDHQLALLKRNGYRDIVFCTGHLGHKLKDHLGDGGRFGLRIRYADDGPFLLGTGGALRKAGPLLGEAFAVLYGDSYLPIDYARVEQAFAARGKPALMTVYRNRNNLDRSNAIFRDGMVVEYDKEKPGPEMEYIDYGLSIIRRDALAGYPAEAPFDLATVFKDLSRAGLLAGLEVVERFYEIGSAAGLAEAEEFLK